MRRIRRPVSEHDQVTAIAAERDRARDALRELQESVRNATQGRGDSQSSSRIIARNAQGEELDVTENARSRVEPVNRAPLNRSTDWWFPIKWVMIIFGTAGIVLAAAMWITGGLVEDNQHAEAQEQKLIDLTHQMTRLAKLDARILDRVNDVEKKMYDISRQAREARTSMRETYNRRFASHFEMIMEIDGENSYDTNAAPQAEAIPPSIETSADTCTEGGVEDMRCSTLAEAKQQHQSYQWQYQGQDIVGGSITHNVNVPRIERPQVDVRPRAGINGFGCSGGACPNVQRQDDIVVHEVREDVLSPVRDNVSGVGSVRTPAKGKQP